MTDELLDRVLTRSREAAYRRRTPAYRWLRERHERLRPAFDELEPPLREIAAEMARGGIDGGHGKPLTAKALARIWQRVCRDLRAEAAGKRDPEKVHPSRLPSTWRPTLAEPPRAPVAPRPVPTPGTVSAPSAPRELNEAARATLASLQAQLDYADRYVRPQKRKE